MGWSQRRVEEGGFGGGGVVIYRKRLIGIYFYKSIKTSRSGLSRARGSIAIWHFSVL
jgi:hypothetical protein